MTKVRLTVTSVYEYEIIPYVNAENDEQRMEYDIGVYQEDPGMLDMLEAKSFEIKGELIEEESNHE